MWQQTVKEWLGSEEIDRSQAWLARKAGCSESYLSRCLTRQAIPSDAFLFALEAAMGIPRGILVEGKRATQPNGTARSKSERDAAYRRPAEKAEQA